MFHIFVPAKKGQDFQRNKEKDGSRQGKDQICLGKERTGYVPAEKEKQNMPQQRKNRILCVPATKEQDMYQQRKDRICPSK